MIPIAIIEQAAEQAVLNDQTLVTIGTVFLVLSPVALAFYWLTKKLNKIDNRLEDIEDGQEETWCAYQQEAFVLRLAKENPDLNVPDVNAAELVAIARRRRRSAEGAA